MLQTSIKDQIIDYARNTLGFDDCRFTNPFINEHLDVYRQWIAQNQHGDMAYLKSHWKFKENPELLLKSVKSAIVVIKNYKNTKTRQLKNPFKIARYAVGLDYHQVIGRRLCKLADFLKSIEPCTECFIGVDSAPIAERSLALKAGVGFLGKNSMVIKPGLGSYFFIGVVLTTTEFESDAPLKWNCGECRLCIDACPTQAITEHYTLNTTHCISYQTIEKKSPMTEEEIAQAKGWLFGCDICQEVCPYNHDKIPLTDWKEFLPKDGVGFDFLSELSLEPSQSKIPKNSPIYRSRRRLIPNLKGTMAKTAC